MRNKLLVILLCTALLLAGCSGKKENKETTEAEQATEATTQVSNETTTEAEQDKEDATVPTSGNDTGVYIGAKEVADVSMGCNENGNQVELCKIKMPTNYYITSNYMEENGDQSPMTEANGKLLSETVGKLEKAPYYACYAVLSSENVTDYYTFQTVKSSEASVETEKENESGGVDLGQGTDHKAYIYESPSDMVDYIMVYQINDDWTLIMLNRGELKDKMSMEEAGQKLYNLINPTK